jgi:flavin reductase (DIM6/NTAB) family NADH-FMN oxidoreductase RutF
MHIDMQSLTQGASYKLLTALVIPRPIAWVTTLNTNGSVNAAPYSFFNVLGNRPPLVAFGPGDKADGSMKDTPRNIARTSNFVVNLVHERVADAMHRSAAPFPEGTSELDELGLETKPSALIETPRIAACKVALECEHHSTIEIGQNRVVFGIVRNLYVRDGLLDPETFMIEPGAFDGIGRLQGPGWYCSSKDQFDLGPFPKPEATKKR